MKIDVSENKEIIKFETEKKVYEMFHNQDCCEDVYVEDICGDLNDLVGLPIVYANESTNHENGKENSESWTWTFYNIATNKGWVTIRWYGESNGYYSESVDIYDRMKEKREI